METLHEEDNIFILLAIKDRGYNEKGRKYEFLSI
jgi:hypothetical protein